jgi:hypothetical protein
VVDLISLSFKQPQQIDRLRPSIIEVKYPNRLRYHGSCDAQLLPSGYGKLTLGGEIVYQGEWRGGKMHGWGKLVLLPFLGHKEREIVEVDGNFRSGLL